MNKIKCEFCSKMYCRGYMKTHLVVSCAVKREMDIKMGLKIDSINKKKTNSKLTKNINFISNKMEIENKLRENVLLKKKIKTLEFENKRLDSENRNLSSDLKLTTKSNRELHKLLKSNTLTIDSLNNCISDLYTKNIKLSSENNEWEFQYEHIFKKHKNLLAIYQISSDKYANELFTSENIADTINENMYKRVIHDFGDNELQSIPQPPQNIEM